MIRTAIIAAALLVAMTTAFADGEMLMMGVGAGGSSASGGGCVANGQADLSNACNSAFVPALFH
jgi:hypothetical protein